MYVSRSQEIQKTLLDKFSQLNNAFVKETRLDFQIPPGIELRYAFRILPETGVLSLGSPMRLGPIVRQISLKALLEFVVHPQAVQQNEVTVFEGKMSITLTDEGSPTSPIPIRLVRPVTDSAGMDIPSVEIMKALSHLRLYRLQEQARIEVTAGEYDRATEHLHYLATHLLSQGERALARTVLMEAEHVQQNKSFSQQGRKEIKYGTRALLMSGRSAVDQ